MSELTVSEPTVAQVAALTDEQLAAAAGTPWDPARQAAGEAKLAELTAQEAALAAEQNQAAQVPTPPV